MKLTKDTEEKTLVTVQKDLISVLKQVVEIKRTIEEGSEQRLEDFVDRKIPLGKLYIYDLTKMTKSEIFYQHRRNLIKFRRHVLGSLKSEDGVYSKPIGQLDFKGKQK